MPTVEHVSTEPLQFLHNVARVHVDAELSGGGYALVELTGPHGDMPPLHVHTREDEAFYVLAGRLTVIAGELEVELHAGDSVLAPRGIPHVYRVDSDEARWLALVSPAGFESFVREVAATGTEVGPAELTEIAARYGIEILGPPGALPG
jgi:quercetin dioxygenase-like cupin family protein